VACDRSVATGWKPVLMSVSICSNAGRRPGTVAVSQPGLSWLKDYSFHLFPYMAIARWLVTTAKGRRLTELSFLSLGYWVCHSVSSRLLLWFTIRLGRAASRFPLELGRWPGYVLVLNLISFGDFVFSLDLCSFGVPDRLYSECFGTHLWSDEGVGERGEGGRGCLLPVT